MSEDTDKYHVTVVTADGLLVTMLGLCDMHTFQLLQECPETTFQSMCITAESGEEMVRWHANKGYSHDGGRTWQAELVNCAMAAMTPRITLFSTSTVEH